MRFTSLTLRQFRNHESLDVCLNAGVTVLYGPNGSGKTNLLEALHLLSLGRSHRTAQDAEMIQTGKSAALARGQTQRLDGRHDIELRLYAQARPHKRVRLFGKPAQRVMDLMGHATTVMFSPEDLRIVRDGPPARRRFVDMQLSQIRPGYLRALKTYLSALENRNALLRQSRLYGAAELFSLLDAWDEQLAAAAAGVVEGRRWFLVALGQEAARTYRSIAQNPDEPLGMEYAGPLSRSDAPGRDMLAGLAQARREDIRRQYTTFGPHRDDMRLTLCGQELRAFGSQGQVRSAVLSLKLGEIRLIEREMGEPPALLLDDVFSELDVRRRAALLSSADGLQTVITCTDRQDAAGARADAYWRTALDERGLAVVTEG